MKIALPYGQKEEAKLTDSELTLDYITHAVNQKFDKGISGSQRRMFGRIQRKFDFAIENGDTEISFEESEMDFIKDAFKDVKFPPALAKYVLVLEEELYRQGTAAQD